MNIEMKILDPRLIKDYSIPGYATTGSGAIDVRAMVSGNTTIQAGDTQLIPTGFSIALESPEIVAILLPRSGLGHKHGIVLGNSVDLIDSDYREQVFISCWNRSNKSYVIEVGERLGQLMFVPIKRPQITLVDEFSNMSDRDDGVL